MTEREKIDTDKCIVTHKAPHTPSFGTELAAAIQESLETPVWVCDHDALFPLIFEPFYMPTSETEE